jgi:hypothetical protein
MIRRSLELPHGAVPERRTVNRAGPRASRKSFNWRGCLIEAAIAVAVLNIVAAIAWYFILRHLNR